MGKIENTGRRSAGKKRLLWGSFLGMILVLSGCSAEETPEAALPPSTQQPVIVPQSTASEEKSPVTVAEQEIYNQDGISVTVTGLESGLLGEELQFLVENKTEKNIALSTRYLSVNGYMMDTSVLYTQVAAGKKAKDTLTIYRSELDRCSIETLADLEFYLHILDSDTYADIGQSPLLKVSTSASGSFTQVIQDQGQELLNEQGIRVVSQGLKEDRFWEGTLVIYLENNSQENVTVYAENVSVNGFMVTESMWADLRPGTRAVDGMLLLDLENTDIDSLDQISHLEFTLQIIRSDDWTPIVESHPVELAFG